MKVKPTQFETDDRLTVAASARIIGIHPQTLRDWEKAGLITSTRTPGGHRRYSRHDIEALAAGESPATDERPSPTKNSGAA